MARGKAPTFELQRTAILEAAAALFARRGFHNASMSALAEACGVSKPLLYHYYRDKEHILFDIADSYIDRLLAIIEDVDARALDGEAHFSELVIRFMEEYEHAHDQHLVIVQDVKFLQRQQAARVAEKQRKVVAAFAAAIVRLEPDLVRYRLDRPVTMILFGMINWTFTWMRTDGRLTFRDMGPVVTGIFLNGIRGFVEQGGRIMA